MRICLLGRGGPNERPDIAALALSLQQADHDVHTVMTSPLQPTVGTGVEVTGRRPRGLGPVGHLLRKAQPSPMRHQIAQRGLRSAVKELNADLLYPLSSRELQTAASAVSETGAVFRQPDWPSPGERDLAKLGGSEARWQVSTAGPDVKWSLPPRGQPVEGRHRGTKVALAFRNYPTSPGHYLKEAMWRAGIEVFLIHDRLDWATLPSDTAGLLIVESKLPRIDLIGDNPGIPVLFWVHHGEHHVETNVRLAKTYRADLILMAHSLHLAHRFSAPVERFNFAAEPSLVPPNPPLWGDRAFDVSLIGNGLDRATKAYGLRHQWAEQLRQSALKTYVGSGLTPAEMVEVYSNSKIVVNEGGTRHFPITMRVFEATSAGALLLTDDLPGTDSLFERGAQYVTWEGDLVDQCQSLLRSRDAATIAAGGRAQTSNFHTYDHRVDRFLALANAATVRSQPVMPLPQLPVARRIERESDIHTVASYDPSIDLSELTDRAVWMDAGGAPQRIDATVVSRAKDIPEAIERSRACVFVVDEATTGDLRRFLPAGSTIDRSNDVTCLDLGTGHYRT